MSSTTIKAGTIVDKSIIAENVTVGKDCKLGVGEELPNKVKPDVYAFGLVTIGEDSVIPDGVQIGKQRSKALRNHQIIRTEFLQAVKL